MKIGIVTINDDNNYGNRLQNYAVQEVCNKIEDVETFTIKNSNRLNNKDTKIRYFLKYILFIKDILINFIKKNNRVKLFKEFNKNIKFNSQTINWYRNYKKIGKNYDIFIVGSDQVWNPYGRMTDVDLLKFTENKKVSFSASLSVSKVDEKYYKKMKEEINKFAKVSVRENTGKEILEKVTERRDIEVLVDPTMLLTAKEWNKVSKKPKQLKSDKYILNYFLGELSEERKNEINRIAKENNCEVINILDKNSPFYETGPSEFLYLEENAFLICTDSFHSSVFAILYNRPFIVFEREDSKVNMNSRLETLLSKFKLEKRYYKGKITDELLQTDYIEAYKILEEERKKADLFLKKALDIK